MNPLQKRVNIFEVTEPGALPSLVLSFANVADMQAASDHIRSLPSSLERGFDSLVAQVIENSAPPRRDE